MRLPIPYLAAAYALILLAPSSLLADRNALPDDFPLPPITYGGAGGGTSRSDAMTLTHCPIILIPDGFRDHTDWTGSNPGNTTTTNGNVYATLLQRGFKPIEIWMIDLSPAGHYMSSIEEATDDLKLFMTAVMQYTGANRIQLVAHGSGGLLARLTLLKYNIAHWVAAEVYIDTPFQGDASKDAIARTLAGDPTAWALMPNSPLLHEIQAYGETPTYSSPRSDIPFRLPTLTIGPDIRTNGRFNSALRGAQNLTFPDYDHNALRCSPETVAAYADFLKRPALPLLPEHDRDADGFRGYQWGGPDFDDNNPHIYPGAPEILGDGIDQDCNGCDKADHGGREMELPIEDRDRTP